MVKLNLLLSMVLLACALSVVTARHQARKLFMALQAEQAQARNLDIEWGRLQLEIATWLTHNRVGDVASERLRMAVPEPQRMYLLEKAQP
jgi:cell division protein FtsL